MIQIGDNRRPQACSNRTHSPLFYPVDIQRQRADGDAHHRLRVVEELDGLRVEGKVVCVLPNIETESVGA